MSTDDFVQLGTDGNGKKMRTMKETIGAHEVHSETVVVLGKNGTALVPLAVDPSGKLRCKTT